MTQNKKTFTELGRRNLWYDGSYEVESDDIPNLILDGVPLENIFAKTIDSEIEKFNSISEFSISEKHTLKTFDKRFLIPEEYQRLDLKKFFYTKVKEQNLSYDEEDRRITRIDNELAEFAARGYLDILKTVIYLIECFKQKGVVWGVGRGSSCASYLLYLIGVHCVDPVKWNIHFSEFLHD